MTKDEVLAEFDELKKTLPKSLMDKVLETAEEIVTEWGGEVWDQLEDWLLILRELKGHILSVAEFTVGLSPDIRSGTRTPEETPELHNFAWGGGGSLGRPLCGYAGCGKPQKNRRHFYAE